MKKMFEFKTRTIAATAIGTALFLVLFMFVKIPTGIPNTEIQFAMGVGAFIAALFGPICGFLMGFIGHALNDAIQYGSVWWSWVTADGVYFFLIGLSFTKIRAAEGEFNWKDVVRFCCYCLVAAVVAWGVLAPVLDIVIYAEDPSYVFTQGLVAGLGDFANSAILGSVLLWIYSLTRAKKGSLSKED